MEKVYYGPKGYWKGVSAIDKLAEEADVTPKEARDFLKKQALWKIFLPAPKYIPRATCYFYPTIDPVEVGNFTSTL